MTAGTAGATHARGVLDTSTVIMLSRLTDATLLPKEPVITAVTLAELSVGPLVASTDADRAARQAHVQQAEADFDPLPFDAPAARAFGRVAAALRQSGRTTRARAYDALIAATALANGLPVYTCNPDDFAGIEGLEVVAVPVPVSTAGAAERPMRPHTADARVEDQHGHAKPTSGRRHRRGQRP